MPSPKRIPNKMSNTAEQYLNRARELTEAGQLDGARQCLLEVLKENPDNQAALIALGGIYFTQQQYNEAEMVFVRLILKHPGKGEYSIALFNTLWKMDRHAEALEEIKRFLEMADKEAEKTTVEQYMNIIKKLEA
ncbi:MAG: tetratricopeptide repeat protein [Gammaproteobacteria bacterium]|nr:tetratricopeptide repeat protein [Gammaproteobacteria bacterium]